MDLSPLNQLAGLFDGAETLSGFDTTNVQPGQRVRGSARQFVRFYLKKFPEMVATEVEVSQPSALSPSRHTKVLKTELREVEKLMVNIVTPGDKNEIDDVATEWHKREFFPEYQNFKNGNHAPIGTSVNDSSVSSFISPAIATELIYLKVYTVEQLAEATDEVCRLLGPDGHEIRETARQWLLASANDPRKKEMLELQRKNEELQRKMAEMEEKLSGLVVGPSGRPIRKERV